MPTVESLPAASPAVDSNGQPVHADAAAVRRLVEARQRIRQEVARVIVGQSEIVDFD